MNIENSITVVQLDQFDLKKVCKEFDDLRFNHLKTMYTTHPALHDLLSSLTIQLQNRANITSRKIGEL